MVWWYFTTCLATTPTLQILCLGTWRSLDPEERTATLVLRLFSPLARIMNARTARVIHRRFFIHYFAFHLGESAIMNNASCDNRRKSTVLAIVDRITITNERVY